MIIFLYFITFIVKTQVFYTVLNNKKETTDAIRFLNEYSEYNGKVNEANGKKRLLRPRYRL